MVINSNIGVNIIRSVFVIIIIAAIYNYNVNPVLFGLIIVIFIMLLLISGTKSIELSENEVSFKFQRLIPVCARKKSINLKEIKSIEFIEGKIDDTALLLNILFLEYIPGTIRSEDEIVVELSNG